ncbi:unnamed protein product [Discula destructiva]
MDIYNSAFAAFFFANAGAGFLQYRSSKRLGQSSSVELGHEDEGDGKCAGDEQTDDSRTAWNFKLNFLSVYSLVMGSDWLQGPYQYALYKDERQLPEQTIGFLFAVGFLSAAASASYVGFLADKHGRRQMCLAFCIMYSLSCLTKISRSLPILFVGRALGGVSTTLLYSVFEAWMVHEHSSRGLHRMGLPLNEILGQMATCSSLGAIAAGVLGQVLVDLFGTNVAPFLGSIVLLGLAFLLVLRRWPENYGTQSDEHQTASDGIGGGTGIRSIAKDGRIVAIGLITCLFEGTMYLFVFFWTPGLESARALVHADSPPPFGLVFSTFMCAMMLGSQIATISGAAGKVTVASVAQTLMIVLLVASVVLPISMLNMMTSEFVTLWGFCIYELCVGMYFPAIGYLRGELVHGGIRGRVYGLLRLPLNVFVFFALLLTQEGEQHRGIVFVTCSGLLIIASFVASRF